MSGQNYTTVGGVVVLYNGIMDHLDNYIKMKRMSKGYIQSIKMAAKAAYDKIVPHYKKVHNMQCIATLLDPRCNLGFFAENGFGKVDITPIKTR